MKHIAKGRKQICNKTFVKMMDELGYDAELTYKKKQQTEVTVERKEVMLFDQNAYSFCRE